MPTDSTPTWWRDGWRLAAAWIRHRGAAGVVATGGDGAREVLRALDAGGIALADEVMGGVPLGTLTEAAAGLPIVTKAGGFGTEDVLFAPCARSANGDSSNDSEQFRNLPLLAVTLGDVAGIGPEITAKMLMGHEALRAKARLVVVGDAAVMANAVRGLGGDPSIVRTVARPADATNAPGTIEVVQAGPSLAHVKLGEISAEAGDGSVRFVTTACAGARRRVDAIVTAPLNKAAMHAAGHKWPGHTELLAHEFGVKTFSLVLSAGDLYVFHATTHVSLRQAIEDVNPARMRAVLRLPAPSPRRWAVATSRWPWPA